MLPTRLFNDFSDMRFPLLVLLAGLTVSATAQAPVADKLSFNRDVLPILSDNCFACHGPDANHREADLRLDLREDAIAAEAIVASNVAQSKLIQRVLSADRDQLMPPPSSNKRLSAVQIETLRKWIEQGAEYETHWSFQTPVKQAVPADAQPVDFFVNHKLQSLGLQPSAKADRRTLIRRLYADLIGLPPKPDEVAAFVADSTDDAYARLVEKLLASPHFGERMAIGWLDVVRFADTIGYHSDNPRNVWPYRDWVIRSFNDNKPFDAFTREQIAGDLLPAANSQTRVASAFNRLLLSTEEGGAQAKDYEARMLTDRVRAIGSAWLGLTTGCAQCHDHKFDPLTTRDFYSLGAFFADIQEPIIGKREEGMAVTTADDDAKLAALDAAVSEVRQRVEQIVPQWNAAQLQWEQDIVAYGIILPELQEGSKSAEADKNQAKQVTEALKKDIDKRSGQDSSAIQTYYRTKVTKQFTAERDALTSAEQARQQFYDSLPKCLVSIHSNQPRTVRILPRGNWMDESGEVVKAALPQFLVKAPADRELTRLDLADWLVSRDNPLTARTTMNRLWKHLFGTGLSRVMDDLGAQGEPPVNAQLLDFLACEFMDRGWDFKQMVRLIVSSEAYQRSSLSTPEQMRIDPTNRYAARQSAYRLEAELIRDFALSAAGLIQLQIGGPSAKPYQPDGYWENLNFPVRQYQADQGTLQYRRGLYTWWQRSFMHPSLLAFDAPSREECTAERNRSNIPQQALVLLNDPTYVEAARSLAGRVMKEASGSLAERVTWAWQTTLQRVPREDELAVAIALYEEQLRHYRDHGDSAAALMKVGQAGNPDGLDQAELAAWTHVARVLLNLHEAITRS